VVEPLTAHAYDLGMSASFTVQRLTSADLLLLRSLNALFGEAFSDPETYGAERCASATARS
jgi:hypothetical protein